jgi:hypothetical protein
VTNPGGARAAGVDGTPLRAYRHDTLSRAYQRTRADHAADARAHSQAKRARAHQTAAAILATHGNMITVEKCAISTWARLWGKGIHMFSPGMLTAALADECRASGGRLQRAGTRSTALSQHCLCGQRVPKPLVQRTHHCPGCDLRAGRDVVSAALAACVELTDPDDPATARVDYDLARALRAGWPVSKRTGPSQPAPTPSAITAPVRPRPAATTRWPLLGNATTLGPPPNRPAPLDVAGPAETQAAQADSVEA